MVVADLPKNILQTVCNSLIEHDDETNALTYVRTYVRTCARYVRAPLKTGHARPYILYYCMYQLYSDSVKKSETESNDRLLK